MFDLPESLVAKARKILAESQAAIDEENKCDGGDKKGKKREEIIINPEVTPDRLPKPIKIETKTK